MQEPSAPHTHKTERGVLVQCYHKCRTVLNWQFFAGVTLSFPIEHFIWEKIWPLNLLAKWMGLV